MRDQEFVGSRSARIQCGLERRAYSNFFTLIFFCTLNDYMIMHKNCFCRNKSASLKMYATILASLIQETPL